jgi:hypothetical protein
LLIDFALIGEPVAVEAREELYGIVENMCGPHGPTKSTLDIRIASLYTIRHDTQHARGRFGYLMILSFRHKGLERFYKTGSKAGIKAEFAHN